MVQTLKKVFSAFVTLTTIAWSVGVGALVLPTAASAATLSAGDLIKASGPAVYYYAMDGKRYVFPNEKTYFSWFADFSSVKTISDSELAAVTIGGNVTIRPGTNLVKITTDPKTYAVTKCGTLHWIESEAVAKALYGNAWATRVVDVADGFFVNYTVGSSISTNVHPDGTLVQYAGDSSWYVVWGGMKRKIASDAALAANGLNKAYGMTTTLTYGNGADVTGREADLADAVCAGSAPVSGGLTVALASDTPAGMTLPKNSSSVALTKVNLMAGGGDVTVTSLQFHRVGVGAVSDFSNVYLYDANGMRLTTGRTINSTTNVVQFNNLNLKVMAGQTMPVVVYGDLAGGSITTGGQHAFELADAASVAVTGSATISGSFPVRGNVFTVGTASAARVDVLKGSTPSNPTVGAKDVEVSNFKLTASTNDVDVKQVTLYQGGSITNSNLSNFKLYQGSTVVATASSVDNNGHITLKFAPAYMISNGSTKVFSLHADVSGRSSLTIRTYVEYTTDVLATDRVYNAGAQICILSSATGCTSGSANFDGSSSNYVEVTTQGGQLTNAFNGPATSNVAKGQLAVPLYKFTLSSPDSTLDVKKMVFTIAKTTGSACKVVGSSGTRYFRSVKVVNTDTGVTMMGPQETGSTSSTSETLTFTDTMTLMAGQSANLALVADLYNGSDDVTGEFSGSNNCGYKASMAAFGSSDVRVVDTGEFLSTSKIVPNSAVTANELTVKTSGLDISLASNPVTGTIVKKQTNADVAGIVLTAAAQSDITITNLTLTGQAKVGLSSCASLNGGSAACYTNFGTLVTSLSLWDGAVQVGQAKAPDTTTGAAQISNMNLVIPKGTSKTLTVKASLSSSVTNTTTAAGYDQIAVGINTASDVQAQDQDANTVTPTISTSLGDQADSTASPSVKQSVIYSGTLTVQADAHPSSAIVIAGKNVWVPLARYKATAQFEAVTIDRIAVTSTSGGDNSDFLAVAVAQNGAVKAQATLPSGITGTKDIDLSLSPISVPKDGYANFEVWAQLANVQSSSSVSGATTGVARSGHQIGIGLSNGLTSGEWDSNYSSKLNMKATGAASGERLYAATGASNGNSMVVRKSQPVVTKQSLSSTTLANIDMDLIKFQVAADSAGSIAWKQAIFSFSKTNATALSNFRLRRGNTDIDTAVVKITNGTSTADLQTTTLAAGVTSGYIVVAMAAGQEEGISGSGNIYTLHATVSGAASGQNVTLSFLRDSSQPIVTGYLTNNPIGVFATSTAIFNIDTTAGTIAQGAGLANATGTFVWSDNSEVPHNSALGTASGSRDWTNDVYVQDLSQSQTVSL